MSVLLLAVAIFQDPVDVKYWPLEPGRE